MKKILSSLALFVQLTAPMAIGAHTTQVRILSTMNVTSVNVSVCAGKYALYLDGRMQEDYMSAKVMQMIVINDSIELRIPGDTIGRFGQVRLVSIYDTSCFKIKPIQPASGTRTYDHSLTVKVAKGFLQCLNSVDLEHYVAGVVESESGGNSVLEFYKVQAILCRTYACAQLNRHIDEGFDVCDGVHCQVYKSRPTDPKVQLAVQATTGLVVIDKNLSLITATFHSNCGGQTANAEDVWQIPVSYLKSVRDTFCTSTRNANWQRKIAKEDWLSYLSGKHKFPVTDSVASGGAMNMKQASRTTNYVYGAAKIPYKTIRADWQLRSAYFSIEEGRDSITISGRGYGHGVGLCQEGAIRMAKLGYSYMQILLFYYRDVEIVNLSRLEFFRRD
ncbi:MAG TPA: SpoIID/LytB domain-containing protein [Bacteroidia bacterium]|nr:SpoIID/LytB domain-containing protein [Bacteroidia bacterium]